MSNGLPLQPIELTLDHDLLVEHSGNFSWHYSEDTVLNSLVGVHKGCGYAMYRRHSNEKFDCLVCSGCFLRILFFREIRTYGELRKYLVTEHNNLRAHRASPWRP